MKDERKFVRFGMKFVDNQGLHRLFNLKLWRPKKEKKRSTQAEVTRKLYNFSGPGGIILQGWGCFGVFDHAR